MIKIFPAIDLLEGRVVRLLQGDYNQVTSYGSPLDCANYWLDQGAKRLHVVDLDGARTGNLVNLKAIEQILSTGIEIQFGGGIRTWENLEHLFEIGVSLAILGTAAIKNQDLIIEALNTYKERIILGLDARNGKVSVEGWLEDSEITTKELLENLADKGLKRFIYTNISRDGAMKGPDLDGVTELCKAFPDMNCIVSGGISSLADIKAVHNTQKDINNIEGIISGKALYEKKFTLQEALNILN